MSATSFPTRKAKVVMVLSVRFFVPCSMRERYSCASPVRSATSAWVRPAARRASRNRCPNRICSSLAEQSPPGAGSGSGGRFAIDSGAARWGGRYSPIPFGAEWIAVAELRSPGGRQPGLHPASGAAWHSDVLPDRHGRLCHSARPTGIAKPPVSQFCPVDIHCQRYAPERAEHLCPAVRKTTRDRMAFAPCPKPRSWRALGPYRALNSRASKIAQAGSIT